MNELAPVQSPDLNEHSAISSHGFFTREGGKSIGIYSGLNTGLGSRDDQETVRENRDLVAAHMGVESPCLLTAYQIHSSKVVVLDKPWEDGKRPQVDALVTAKPGLAVGVMSADCGPVIFLDPVAKVAGAAHAGWKGAIGGVLENTVDTMEKLGAKKQRIIAVLGPTISSKHYEVGPEFVERLLGIDAMGENFLTPSANKNHAMFDLPGFIVNKLLKLGTKASWTGHCTYADESRFFSYRRKTHNEEPDYGRQVSAITLRF